MLVTEEVLLDDELSAVGDQQRMNQRRPPRCRIAIDDRLHHARDRGFVESQLPGARRFPAIGHHRWFAIGVGRAARRPRKELRCLLRRTAHEFDFAAAVRPVDSYAFRPAQVSRLEAIFGRGGIGARRELQVIAIRRHAVLHRRAVRMLFGIAECGHERAFVAPENPEVQGERIRQGTQDTDERVLAGQRQSHRRREGLAGTAGESRIPGCSRPDPEAVDCLLAKRAAESSRVLRKCKPDLLAIRLELGLEIADDSAPGLVAAQDRQFALDRRAERGLV